MEGAGLDVVRGPPPSVAFGATFPRTRDQAPTDSSRFYASSTVRGTMNITRSHALRMPITISTTSPMAMA